MMMQYEMGRVTQILEFPVWISYLIIPFSGAVLIVRYIGLMIALFRNKATDDVVEQRGESSGNKRWKNVWILLAIFVVLMMMHVPIAVAMGLSSLIDLHDDRLQSYNSWFTSIYCGSQYLYDHHTRVYFCGGDYGERRGFRDIC